MKFAFLLLLFMTFNGEPLPVEQIGLFPDSRACHRAAALAEKAATDRHFNVTAVCLEVSAP